MIPTADQDFPKGSYAHCGCWAHTKWIGNEKSAFRKLSRRDSLFAHPQDPVGKLMRSVILSGVPKTVVGNCAHDFDRSGLNSAIAPGIRVHLLLLQARKIFTRLTGGIFSSILHLSYKSCTVTTKVASDDFPQTFRWSFGAMCKGKSFNTEALLLQGRAVARGRFWDLR